MKISELYSQVAQLGFEDSLEDDDRFFYAANRALLQVCKIRPAVSRYMLNHKPLENYVKTPSFEPIERSEDLTFEATDVKSFYAEADGNGMLYIEKLDAETQTWVTIGSIPLESSGAFVSYKGFIKEGSDFLSGLVRLRFSGDYLYSVKNVAMYKHLRSGEEEDIPAYEPFCRYDIRTLAPDFLALCCPPITENEENSTLNQEYELEGDSVILLPRDKRGVYKVLYQRRPEPLENTGEGRNDETVIDLDEELCSLLPVLIAGYVWVDDEPQKAEYYMALYRERAEDIERRSKDNSPVQIKSVNGW